MNLVSLNSDFLKDEEIVKYLSSFTNFHAWLLEEDNILQGEAFVEAKDVLSFIKSGVKVKKKKSIKLYFEQFDIESIKQYIKPLTDLINANTNEDIGLVLSKKNELISLGILSFTKQYIEQVTQFNQEQLEEKQIGQQVQQKLTEDEEEAFLDQPSTIATPYTNWLRGEIASTLEKLKEAYNTTGISDQLVRSFVKDFRRFVGGKLLLRITEMNEKTVVGIPLEITSSGYEEMDHPFLNISWEAFAPIERHLKKIKYKVGDVVEASFKERRNDNLKHLLIFVDFVNATVVPRTITEVLQSTMKSSVMKDVFDQLNVSEQNDEQIQAFVIQKVSENSDLVKGKLNSELEKLQNQFEELKEKEDELELKKHNLDEKEKEWVAILKRIDFYKNLNNFRNDNYKEEDKKSTYEPTRFIEQLQSLFYYNDDQQLVYNKEIIRSFVYALQSNILTVLAGPSGTGKSSIVHAFANAVENVEVRMVPVQSSWTDTQDLLGYFHPTDKAFVPTPFMEAMAEARLEENINKIFLICLDEMNLAHVEYYFSEILSAREEKKQEIRLYPKRHWETAKLILKEGQGDVERLHSAAELIELYPPVFNIPPNVRFIGTLNMDHTVKPLSPKVIDRSFIIEINHLSASEKRTIISSLNKVEGKVQMNHDTFIETHSDEIVIGRYIEQVQAISNLFEEFPNASLNSRGIKHITKMLTYCNDESEMDQLLDYLIYGKILPRLEIKKNDFVIYENNINREIRKYKESYEKLQKMLQAKHTITFW